MCTTLVQPDIQNVWNEKSKMFFLAYALFTHKHLAEIFTFELKKLLPVPQQVAQHVWFSSYPKAGTDPQTVCLQVNLLTTTPDGHLQTNFLNFVSTINHKWSATT